MNCNFTNHSYVTRFLIASLRKKDYTDNQSGNFLALMRSIAEECKFMSDAGVCDNDGLPYWAVTIAITGDWPWLAKCGGFSRSFHTVQRRAVVRAEPQGICHLCLAGKNLFGERVDFEQVATRRPFWNATQFSESPFSTPSPFAEILHDDQKLESLWSFDWFHTMQLGVLKVYLGSVLVLLSDAEQGNVDERFRALTLSYTTWCHQNRRRAHCAKISKEMLGWETTSCYPAGTWHKGALTTVLMEYIESRFNNGDYDTHEPLLTLAAEACASIQRCSRLIYRKSLWLGPAECKEVAELGFQFLRRFSQMASEARRQGRCLFIFQPKIHCLHHFMVQLWADYERNVKGLNPLAFSCQQSEDFIGRPSRLSRRVTAQRPVLHRILDRYLQSAYGHFLRMGYLVRPL